MSVIGMLIFLGSAGAIVGVLIWLLVAYPKQYKKNVNKALHSGVPVKTIEPTILFGVIALIALIVMNITLIASVSNLKQDIQRLETDIEDMSYRVQGIFSDVNNIETAILRMYEEDQWVDRWSYEIIDLNTEREATIEVSIWFNRIPKNGEITLLYESNGNVSEEIITSTNSIFTKTITIDLDSEYEFSVMIDDSTLIESESLFNLDVDKILNQSKQIYLDEEVMENGHFVGTITISNNYALHSDLAFSSVEMIVKKGGVTVDTETKTIPTRDSGTLEEYEFWVDWSAYGDGIVTVTFLGIDGFGDEYVMFGEGFEVALEE